MRIRCLFSPPQASLPFPMSRRCRERAVGSAGSARPNSHSRGSRRGRGRRSALDEVKAAVVIRQRGGVSLTPALAAVGGVAAIDSADRGAGEHMNAAGGGFPESGLYHRDAVAAMTVLRIQQRGGVFGLDFGLCAKFCRRRRRYPQSSSSRDSRSRRGRGGVRLTGAGICS